MTMHKPCKAASVQRCLESRSRQKRRNEVMIRRFRATSLAPWGGGARSMRRPCRARSPTTVRRAKSRTTTASAPAWRAIDPSARRDTTGRGCRAQSALSADALAQRRLGDARKHALQELGLAFGRSNSVRTRIVFVMLADMQQDLGHDVGVAAQSQAEPEIVVLIEALLVIESADLFEERTLRDYAR